MANDDYLWISRFWVEVIASGKVHIVKNLSGMVNSLVIDLCIIYILWQLGKELCWL